MAGTEPIQWTSNRKIKIEKLKKYNKYIGDDTKAAARQSLNCIKNQKIKYGEERFSI